MSSPTSTKGGAKRHPEVAALIATRLMTTGLQHPGDVDNNVQPSVVKLPGFNTTGMTPDQADKFVGLLGKMLGEAIVHLIVTDGDCEIIKKVDTKAWREHTAALQAERDNLAAQVEALQAALIGAGLV